VSRLAGTNSFGDAFTELWNNLVHGHGTYKGLRWIIALLLIIGIVWSGFMFKKVLDFTRPSTIKLPPAKNLAEEDSRRLESIIDSFRAAVMARTGSSTLSLAASNTSRKPFVPSQKPLPLEELEEILAKEEAELALEQKEQRGFMEPEKAIPPVMTVRAIMTMPRKTIAVMDIEGEGMGLVVKTGFVFGEEQQGKITAILPEKVVIDWEGETIDVPAGM